MKNNGLTPPPHPLQVTAIIIYILDCLIFLFVLLPGTINVWPLAILFTLLYVILSIAVAVVCFLATYTDPTDRNVIFERKMRALGKEVLDSEELEYYCDVCQAYVSDRSKHCGDCNRCVELFDHHCKWMNNCVGAKNYYKFLLLISLVLVQSIVFELNAIFVII